MADELEHPTPSTSSDRSPAAAGDNPAVEALGDATAHEASLDEALAPHEIGSEGLEMDESAESSGSSGSSGSSSTTSSPGLEIESEAKSDAFGLSADDLANLASRKDKVVLPEERIENQRFVKFADVLPPCPPRGGFDVNRIRDSVYFFS
jgi:DNA-directed RNA polymerase